ncbi:thiamine pyrophosphate-binding protein [Sphaerotilus sp.]|uniref:thiamine pyrophosphate-binding protein n=1 Tax=Sphaerotilus sp. TaxID=2093942 RepID=UPI0034E2E546
MITQFVNDHFDREYRTQAVAPVASQTVATYLNTRLKQIGVSHVFCIPGDYLAEWAATLDDPAQNAGLVRIHPNNEMCATYAADGYGRVANGVIGCVAFTYGAGGINAAQAVAGAYAEYSPLVVINGSPSVAQFNSQRDQGVLYHHMLNGSHTDQRIFAEITEIAVRIDNPATAPALIDAALQTCLTTSRPVYIELASQTAHMACAPVPQRRLSASRIPSSPASVAEACAAVMAHLKAAERVVIIGGAEIARFGLQKPFAELLRRIDAPYATSPLGKSVLSELRTDVRFAGVYFGRSSSPALQQLLEAADCVLALGVQDTDFNYLGVVTPDYNPAAKTTLPGPDRIQARNGAVLVGRSSAYWGDVGLADLIAALLDALAAADGTLAHAPFPGIEGPPSDIPPTSQYPAGDPITFDSFKSYLHHEFLKGHDADHCPQIIADSGFSFLSNIDLQCGEGGYIAQLAWAAIGYGVGATPGVVLANEVAGRTRRTVTITGDGAFAETLNALGTIAQLGQDVLIFVMDNRVFAVEQWLINADAFCDTADAPPFVPLTAVPQGAIWDYVKLAEGFGGRGFAVASNAQLSSVLGELKTPCINTMTGKPTFTLIAVRLPAKCLPGNAAWKMKCG